MTSGQQGGLFVIVVFAALAVSGRLSPSGTTRAALPASPAPGTATASPAQLEQMRKNDMLIQRQVTLKLNSWEKGGFDNILMADFTVTNTSGTPIKDFTVKRVSYAPSGTAIDQNEKVVYEIVKTQRRFRRFSMGFLVPQASQTGCTVMDFALVTP